MKIQIFFIIITALISNQVLATLYNYDEIGAVSDDNSLDILINNQQILNTTINQLKTGDSLIIPNRTYHLLGGIQGSDLYNISLFLHICLIMVTNLE